jgi:hypothetical protein
MRDALTLVRDKLDDILDDQPESPDPTGLRALEHLRQIVHDRAMNEPNKPVTWQTLWFATGTALQRAKDGKLVSSHG